MAEDTAGEDTRYWAFISYSHKDAAFGRRLHRRLEAYAVPRRLVGRATSQGPVPRKLVPIFRDREELPAASDLSAEVRAALKASRSLIVICSPSAQTSRWVSREIEVFRQLHPDRPVLAVLRSGEPSECFPAELRNVKADGTFVEPLAADFRRRQDGEELGLLKLVAGVIGIGLDELVQRDAYRRTQRVTAVTAGALAAMLVMGVLTVFAINARQDAERQRAEAQRQRGEAEGLVEYMLTDLREKLKGVGRLDVMMAVNERALHYYSDQELEKLPVASLERRARILHAMGEDDENRGDIDAALAKFREASRTTAALLAEMPNDPERIYTHAQSEFWMGTIDYRHGRFAQAKVPFEAYKRLSDRLVSMAPDNPVYIHEAAYAEGDLCSVALQPPQDPGAALRNCLLALEHTEIVAGRDPSDEKLKADLANRHGWLADAYLAGNAYDRAESHRLIQERMLDELLKSDPRNMNLRSLWIASQRQLAWLEARRGDKDHARTRLERAMKTIDEMTKFDDENKYWSGQKASLEGDFNSLK